MAGIGFELKKMFRKKGLLALVKAYGYAGIVCIGPMILGVVMLLGIRVIAGIIGADEQQKQLLNCMITDTLLFSLVFTNLFSLVTTRFIADQLFVEKKESIMPSFWGSTSIMLVAGGVLFSIFLACAGLTFSYCFLCFTLFGELILVWSEINYLTAIKDYQGILVTFIVAVIASCVSGYIIGKCGIEPIIAMLLGVCIGYGIMSVCYFYLLVRYFPIGNESYFHFLEWFDRYPQLMWVGVFLSLGLFGHLVIMWFSPIGVQIQGLFYTAAEYEVPALFAFLSILVTTINFVTSVEVNFYPKYRNYFSLFNDSGTLLDIEQAEKEMKATLVQELAYTFNKQFFATIVFVIGGTFILPTLPLGMTTEMIGIYQILCIAYAFYAIGNCVMLIQLYFSDLKGAMISTMVFMVGSCIPTICLWHLSVNLYGLGFLAGSFSFAIVSLILLNRYLKKIIYHVLCNQPIVTEVKCSWITKISKKMQGYYLQKFEFTANFVRKH